jgi:mycothiol synthase
MVGPLALAPLPPGFSVRAPSPEDAEAVAGLGIAQDIDDVGEADYSVDDVESEWAAPGFDLGRDAWLVLLAGDTPVPAAYGALEGHDARVFVDPQFKGRGLGSHLAGRIEEHAAGRGLTHLWQMTFGGNDAARELLARRGYVRDQNYWRMRIDLTAGGGSAPKGPLWPDGVAARVYDPEQDEQAVHALVQAAFADVPGFVPQERDAWRIAWGSGEKLVPSLSTVVQRNGDVIASATCGHFESDGTGWVTQLAVDPDERGNGLGRALLLESFCRAEAEGLPAVGLSVNAANAHAMRLYESAGMRVEWHSDRWEKRF